MVRRTMVLALAATLMAPVAPGALPRPAAGTALPARAAEVGTWGPVTRVDRGEIVMSRRAIAIDGRDDVTAVWGCPNLEKACASSLPSGGEWEPREFLGRGSAPAVAVGSNGGVTAAWHGPRGVVVARKRPGRAWSAPVVLDKRGWGPDLAVGPGGRVTVAWMQRKQGEKTRIRAASHLVRGTWTAPVNVTRAVGAVDPQLGMGGQGVVTLVYVVGPLVREEKPGVLKTRRWLRGKGWSAPVVLARRSVSEVLATDPSGDAAVLYLRKDFGRLHAVVRTAGQGWAASEVLSPAGVDYLGGFSAAFDADRSVLVTWARNTGRVDLVRRPLAGSWSPPTRLAAKGGWWTEVRTSASGDAFVAWANDGVYGRYRPAGGTWGARQTLSREGRWPVEDFSVAISPTGDVVVLWSREERFRLKARVLTVP